jgi:predicted nucleic acid-binding protein
MTQSRLRRNVLVDSSAHLGLLDTRERVHAEAVVIQRQLIAEHWRVFTTNLLIAETHALILNRLNRRIAVRFLTEMDRAVLGDEITVIRIELEDEARAREIIYQYEDKDFTLTDATSFAVMEREGIRWAFTFDRDFVQYGLDVLRP